MPVAPVIIHVIPVSICHSIAARDEDAAVDPAGLWATPVPAPITSIVTIDEDTAFPILIPATPATLC